jgi:hypothetical protein
MDCPHSGGAISCRRFGLQLALLVDLAESRFAAFDV